MRSVQVSKPKGQLEMYIPESRSRQECIKIQACGICHGDCIVKEGLFPGIEYPRTPGQQIAGNLGAKGVADDSSRLRVDGAGEVQTDTPEVYQE